MNDFNEENVPYFSLKGNSYEAKCVKVYDGDTITVVFKYSGKYYKWRVRLLRINAPEISDGGTAARDILRNLVFDKNVTIVCDKFDAFGRILAEVYVDKLNINDEMLKSGLVKEFKV